MFLYNTTLKVNNNIVDEWLQWQKEIHIPEILATGLFYDYNFFELLEQDISDGRTFIIQYLAHNRKSYHEYMNHHAPFYLNKEIKKWGNQFVSFQTLLQAIN